jgi:arylsulfatase A-like enzyme
MTLLSRSNPLREKDFRAKQALLAFLCILVTTSMSYAAGPAVASEKPNVLFILADDMGWMDSSPYGSKYYQTPGLERLAAMGMTFTRAYSASPVCSPTRLSFMTGKYPARLRMTAPRGHKPPPIRQRNYSPLPGAPYKQVKTPVSVRFMPTEEYTLGEAFRDAGYTTGFVGKWHLGLNPEHWPQAQGFDYVFHGAPDAGPPSYFSPYSFKAGTVTNGPEGEYITERATVEAINFIKSVKKGPWMLSLWHWAVHAPFQAPKKLVDKYSKLEDPRGHQNNPTMGGMIESLDTSINDVLDALDELGLTENTIIVFYSDNGGNMYDEVGGEPPTNNFPLRNGKGSIYEGGTRVPAIVVWPGTVEEGATSDALISSIDMYPTMLDMAGITPQEGHLIDGISITETLKSNKHPERDAIFTHFPNYSIRTKNRPATSVIQGEWKYIRFYDSNGPNGYEPKALYNLKDDVGENKNLWEEMPDKVAAMDAMITQHIEDIDGVIPTPNPGYIEGSHNPLYDDPIDMWVPNGDCDIRKENGALRVISTGWRPSIYNRDNLDIAVPATLSFRVKLKTGTEIEVQGSDVPDRPWGRFWQQSVEITADDTWHEYSIEVAEFERLQKLRIYPGNARGDAFFDWIRISDKDGQLIKSWEFDD